MWESGSCSQREREREQKPAQQWPVLLRHLYPPPCECLSTLLEGKEIGLKVEANF